MDHQAEVAVALEVLVLPMTYLQPRAIRPLGWGTLARSLVEHQTVCTHQPLQIAVELAASERLAWPASEQLGLEHVLGPVPVPVPVPVLLPESLSREAQTLDHPTYPLEAQYLLLVY
jgi:hypothetical protein